MGGSALIISVRHLCATYVPKNMLSKDFQTDLYDTLLSLVNIFNIAYVLKLYQRIEKKGLHQKCN